jgi:hypothetical protein
LSLHLAQNDNYGLGFFIRHYPGPRNGLYTWVEGQRQGQGPS